MENTYLIGLIKFDVKIYINFVCSHRKQLYFFAHAETELIIP